MHTSWGHKNLFVAVVAEFDGAELSGVHHEVCGRGEVVPK